MATTPSTAARPAASSTSSPRAARTSSRARCSATGSRAQLTAGAERTPNNATSIDVDRRPRATTPTSASSSAVRSSRTSCGSSSASRRRSRRSTITRDDQAPDRLPPAAARRRAVGLPTRACRAPAASPTARPTSIPTTGFYITDTLDTEVRSATSRGVQHRSEDQLRGDAREPGPARVPGAARRRAASPGVYGPAGQRHQVRRSLDDRRLGQVDVKFNDNKTEVEAVVGWHREASTIDALDPTQRERRRSRSSSTADLGMWGPGFGESAGDQRGLLRRHAPARPIRTRSSRNCPMDVAPYVIGGPGTITDDVEERRAAKLVAHPARQGGRQPRDQGRHRRRGQPLGQGPPLLGRRVHPRTSSAASVGRRQPLGPARRPDGETDPRFDNVLPHAGPAATARWAATRSFKCDYLAGRPGRPGHADRRQHVQLVGVPARLVADPAEPDPQRRLRYEEQRLRYAEFARRTRSTRSPASALGKNAMTLTDMFAPRIGLLYDWTKEGRSKVYGHWGRFYESIPMDINDRSFGGEVIFQQDVRRAAQCGTTDPRHRRRRTAMGCLADPDGHRRQRRAAVRRERRARRPRHQVAVHGRGRSPASSTRSSTTSRSASRTRTAAWAA